MNACACGCGKPTRYKYIRGHNRRGRAGLSSVPEQAKATVELTPQFVVPGQLKPLSEKPFWQTDEDPEQDPPPAYASDDEPGDQGFDQVPQPRSDERSTGARGAGTSSLSITVNLPQQIQDEIAGLLGLMMMIPAESLMMLDPYCAQAWMSCSADMVKAMVPLIAKSERAVAFVVAADGLMLWLNLAVAAKPFLHALIAHHVTKSVQTARDEQGRRVVQQRDYSAYGTAPAAA